jgi:hypothetical protein
MTENKWETVTDEDWETTQRLMVPGGWLYRTKKIDEDNLAVAMVFVPMTLSQALDIQQAMDLMVLKSREPAP